jgi:hypothetical protein
MLSQPANPLCPTCQRPGHPAGGLTTGRWVQYREPVQLDAERTVYRHGYRMEGTVRLICEAGHKWTQSRPPNLQPKRPMRARPRRGF